MWRAGVVMEFRMMPAASGCGNRPALTRAAARVKIQTIV
jgi:hypothetical protein